jgi:hypothetical protein
VRISRSRGLPVLRATARVIQRAHGRSFGALRQPQDDGNGALLGIELGVGKPGRSSLRGRLRLGKPSPALRGVSAFTPGARRRPFALAEGRKRPLLCLRLWDHASGDRFWWQPRQAWWCLAPARSTPWGSCQRSRRSIFTRRPRMTGNRPQSWAGRLQPSRRRRISFLTAVVRPSQEKTYGEE